MSEAKLLEGTVCSDHVHLYIAIPPKLSVSKFMSYLKGKSALMLFDRHPEFRRKNSGRSFWARGYYVVTVGNVNESTIVNYIREQEENDKLEKQPEKQGCEPPLAEMVNAPDGATTKLPFEMGAGDFHDFCNRSFNFF